VLAIEAAPQLVQALPQLAALQELLRELLQELSQELLRALPQA
jgi:hypothetical protein